MIINTGCRTDIPAFYGEWFMNRIKEGYVYVRNPYYPKQVTKYILDPSFVDCIDFCTKNPEPMLKYLDEISHFKQFWFVTITPYGKDIEPNVPDKDKVIKSFQKLSQKLGNNFVGWRYDPIFLNDEFDIEKHIKEFEYIANQLKGYTSYCTISFLDLYEKVKRNAPDLRPPTKEEQIILASSFVEIGRKNNIGIYSCCEEIFLKEYGVNVSGCRNQELVEKSIECKLNYPKIKNMRSECNCLMGNDIGAYDSCGHLCRYCYANTNKNNVISNMKKHIPTSPLLIGSIENDDKITIAKQKSYKIKQEQVTLF